MKLKFAIINNYHKFYTGIITVPEELKTKSHAQGNIERHGFYTMPFDIASVRPLLRKR